MPKRELEEEEFHPILGHSEGNEIYFAFVCKAPFQTAVSIQQLLEEKGVDVKYFRKSKSYLRIVAHTPLSPLNEGGKP